MRCSLFCLTTNPDSRKSFTIDKRERGAWRRFIDQNQFKRNERYGFDSLIFEQHHPEAVHLYIRQVRPNFENNSEDLLLGTRHGKELTKLLGIQGNIVFSVT